MNSSEVREAATVLVIEHNLDVIAHADWVIEPNANRHLSTTHLTDRRLRDHARNYRPPETSTEVPVM